MNVLHVSTSATIGGAERHLLDLVGMQIRQSLEVSVACPGAGLLAERLRAMGIRVHPWSASWRWLPWTRWGLRSAICAASPDLIHAHMSKSAAIAGGVVPRLGLPLVATAHTLVKKPHFSAAQAVLCVSVAVHASLLARGFPSTRARVVHNAVDLTVYRPAPVRAEARQALGLPTSGRLLIQVGRLVPVKSHRTSLHALAQLQDLDASLVLVGDGPLRAELERLAVELGIAERVRFVGFRENVSAWLAAADIYLMPSLKEGFPLALLEAMASGVAPIAARVGGIPEAIEEGVNGLLVPPGEADALAAAIRHLCMETELRERLAIAARQSVEACFSLERQAAAVLDCYRAVLAEAK